MTHQCQKTRAQELPGAALERIETIEAYLVRLVGETWLPENVEHVLNHIRQVEATCAAIVMRGQK